MEIKVPQLAEGVDSGTVVNILVSVGDSVSKDQSVMELETSKAIAPIQAKGAGTVKQIHVKEGDEVQVGQTLVTITEEKGADTTKGKSKEALRDISGAAEDKQAKSDPAANQQEQEDLSKIASEDEPAYQSPTGAPPPASPSVRRTAGEIGIDLRRVRGTARGGRITMQDVKAYIKRLQQLAAAPRGAVKKPAQPAVDFSKWGPIRKEKASKLRKTIAERMQASWTTVPHVTQFHEANIAEIMKCRKKYGGAYEKKGGRLTVTCFALKAATVALKKYPIVNTSLDEATGEIIFKDYYHVGVAVDTEQGLIVPVIKDTDKKSLLDLSIELVTLAEKTRQRKVTMDDLEGATFTISNLGGFGVGHFTPIVNKPEVAILGLGRAKEQASGLMMPVALSYDHRVVDGADGARFIRAFVEAVEAFSDHDFKLL